MVVIGKRESELTLHDVTILHYNADIRTGLSHCPLYELLNEILYSAHHFNTGSRRLYIIAEVHPRIVEN